MTREGGIREQQCGCSWPEKRSTGKAKTGYSTEAAIRLRVTFHRDIVERRHSNTVILQVTVKYVAFIRPTQKELL